jgi:PAS domain S-box-containing protein
VNGRDRSSVGLTEREADRVARVYATLSAAYEAIVRIRQRLPLFDQVCRVLVEQGRLRMAWVGEVDDHGWIVPVAHAGVTDGYLDDLRISVHDIPEGRGPTGIAAREHRRTFVRDIATDERMRPWREAALARGYRSSAAFPLVVDDRCAAVLTAYACEPGFFDEREVELFDRMAADLSFALEAMQREERGRTLEVQLRSSEERFRVAAESMLDGFTILSPVRDDDGQITDFRYRYVNDAYCGLVGFDRGRLLDHRVGEVFPQFLGSARFELYRRVALTGEPFRTDDVRLPSTWAGTALASRVLDTAIASMGEDLVVSARDVTERKRAEAELARVQSLLERTQQITKTGGWEYDVATGRLTWTDEVYRIYGLEQTSDPTEVGPAIAAYDRESAPIIGAAFERLVAEGEPYDLELGLARADGQRIWVRTTGRPTIEGGLVVRVGGHIADITEYKQAEQELQLRAELLDLAHDAVIVREPGHNRVRFWNRGAEAIYGYGRAEAVGCVTHDLLATVFPESAEAVGDALAREGRWNGELRHTRKDGKVIIVSSRQSLQRGEDGRPIAIIELNSDITERKQAEEELAETTGLLERTQQISKTGGWEYDLATGKLTWTDEVYRIYGSERRYGPVELERAISAFDPESAPIIAAALERLVADGEPSDLEVQLIRADGRRIWVRVVGEAVIESGRVVRVRGIIADVSDRRLVEEEIRTLNAELEQRVAARTADLERVNRELESFAYSVSHDLRAPLRAVNGFSQVLLDDYGDKVGEDGRHYLERVRAGAARMGELIDAVLQLSRLSRRRLVRVPVDLSALASEIVAELQRADPDRPVAVEIQDGLRAEADLGLVRCVLQNLLDNAYKFTSGTEHPRVRLGAVEENGVPVYIVADNGAGFDMAHAKGLFRPFHRLHGESEFPGEGIGLATVVQAVHRHGGAAWAHGAVNVGATFYFSLTPGAYPPPGTTTGEDVIPPWQPSNEGGGR